MRYIAERPLEFCPCRYVFFHRYIHLLMLVPVIRKYTGARVDFPHPDLPMRVMNCPLSLISLMSRLKSLNTTFGGVVIRINLVDIYKVYYVCQIAGRDLTSGSIGCKIYICFRHSIICYRIGLFHYHPVSGKYFSSSSGIFKFKELFIEQLQEFILYKTNKNNKQQNCIKLINMRTT